VKKSLLVACVLSIAVIAGGLYWWTKNDKPVANPAIPKPSAKSSTVENGGSTGFNKKSYSNTDPTSVWVIVNKKHALPGGYVPAELVVPSVPLNLSASSQQMQVSSAMAPSLEQMVTAAQHDGINLKLNSGYRSEALQKKLFDNYAARDGVAAAATYSAYPGTSEHQTGLAADLMAANGQCTLEICFADTPEGQWLTAHAHEYGFIIRYPQGKQDITTYQYEPWHIRFVGKELAAQLYSSGLTMEEFFGYN